MSLNGLTADDAMKQAGQTANDYMVMARRSIDELFGDGYADKNPVLLAAFMTTAASDYSVSVSSGVVQGAGYYDLVTHAARYFESNSKQDKPYTKVNL